MRLFQSFLKLLPYIIYLFIVALYRPVGHKILSFGGVEIYLTTLIVLLVALYKEPAAAIWFAWFAGIIYDSYDPTHMGVHSLILFFLAYAAANLKDSFNLDAVKSKLFFLLSGLFLYAIPYILVYQTSGVSEFFQALVKSAIPSLIYTTFFGWLFFIIKTGQVSWQKFKAIF